MAASLSRFRADGTRSDRDAGGSEAEPPVKAEAPALCDTLGGLPPLGLSDVRGRPGGPSSFLVRLGTQPIPEKKLASNKAGVTAFYGRRGRCLRNKFRGIPFSFQSSFFSDPAYTPPTWLRGVFVFKKLH